MNGSRTIRGRLCWQCRKCKKWRPTEEFTSRHATCQTCKDAAYEHENFQRKAAKEKTWYYIGFEPPKRR
jgi:hypothetical protein